MGTRDRADHFCLVAHQGRIEPAPLDGAVDPCRGAALPVVVARAAPLVFRPSAPDCQMEQGVWKIPVPVDGPEVTPDILLAPLVGRDGAGYRLGYGGDYFDRTLAALAVRPLVIGVGLAATHIHSIFPQPHDIAMDRIVTEAGIQGSTQA